MVTGEESLAIKNSSYGIYSFVLGIVALLLVVVSFVIFFYAAVYPILDGKNPDLYLGYGGISYLVAAISLLISISGLVLGILGLRNKKHLFSILGTGLNFLTVLGLLFFLVTMFLV